MNTGIQKSGSTPFGAWTTSTPVGGPNRGKRNPAKNVPLIIAFHGASYVATASPAFLDDYAEKLAKALNGEGWTGIYSSYNTVSHRVAVPDE